MVERQEVHSNNRRPALLLIVVYMGVLLTLGAFAISNRGPETYDTCIPQFSSRCGCHACSPYPNTRDIACKRPAILQIFGRRLIISFVQ